MIRASASVKPHCLKRGVTSQRVGDALGNEECQIDIANFLPKPEAGVVTWIKVFGKVKALAEN